MQPDGTMITMTRGIDYTGVSIVYCCHDGAGRILMAQRSVRARDEQGRWDIGAGALEFGETAATTLQREIFEEYCTTMLSHQFLGFRDALRTHEGRPTHWVALDFAVRVDATVARIGEPHKFDAMGWFTIDTTPAPLHSLLPAFFEKYRDALSRILAPERAFA